MLKLKLQLMISAKKRRSITPKQSRKIENGILVAIDYGLKPLVKAVNDDGNREKLNSTVEILVQLLHIHRFYIMHSHNELKYILVALLEGIYTLIATEDDSKRKADYIKLLHKSVGYIRMTEYFDAMVAIKTGENYSKSFRQVVDDHLLYCFKRHEGFMRLCAAFLSAAECNEKDDLPASWQCCETMAKLVATTDHPTVALLTIAKNLVLSLREDRVGRGVDNSSLVMAAVYCLNRLYQLPLEEIRKKVNAYLLYEFNRMARPRDVQRCCVIRSALQLRHNVKLLNAVFCTAGPPDTAFPTSMLVNYLPLFVQLYAQLLPTKDWQVMDWLGEVVVQCLLNCESTERNQLVESLLFQNYATSARTLHFQVIIQKSIWRKRKELYSLQIMPVTLRYTTNFSSYDPSDTLSTLIKRADGDIVMDAMIVHLLRLFSSFISQTLTQSGDIIEIIDDADSLTPDVRQPFEQNHMIIATLKELIAREPFQRDAQDYPPGMEELFEKILREYMCRPYCAPGAHDTSDELLFIVLSFIQEFLMETSYYEQESIKRLYDTLAEFQTAMMQRHTRLSAIIRKKARAILRPTTRMISFKKSFELTRTLVNDYTGPHLKAYGLGEMLKLFVVNDVDATANAHVGLAIAIKLLKIDDSYVFSNCVKLIIAVMSVVENKLALLKPLITEYRKGIHDVHRAKIGEAIVRVAESLGESHRTVSKFVIVESIKPIIIVNSDLRSGLFVKFARCFTYGIDRYHDMCRALSLVYVDVVLRLVNYNVYFEPVTIIHIP